VSVTEWMGPPRDRLRAVIIAVAVLAVSVGTTVAVGLAPGADETAPVAVLYPPWWSADRAFVAAGSAGGAVVREGAISSLLVARSPEPGFRDRLRATGALLLLDPKALAGCLK
jgi:hypothetical protein